MHSQEWAVAGAPVRGYLWAADPARGAVLLSHGFGEYAGRYVERYHGLIPELVRSGLSVYAYDQRGHGASGGRKAVVDMAHLVADHLKAREALRSQPGPLFLLGHSMGGLISAASVARDPRGVAGVILSSPALLVGEHEPAWIKRLAPIIARIAPGLTTTDLSTGSLSRLSDEVAAYEADETMYHGKVPALTAASMLGLSGALWSDYPRWTVPTLVIHGTHDRITDHQGSVRFVDTIASADKTLVLEEGGFHELLNDEPREKFRELLVDWLRERAPLSGDRPTS
ncbi:alpha/beta hydrolase [Deinococcus koreensis]|uniref:Alpha/beta hydrolase n=1 Tax=Deinococcus koreensis TaxID=2054903 RepID=A0A2K3UUA5_9DEIO|nr:alpha/beta hydrolase [Deinococcus koreensis]PNY80100.1 alpha/beta hydrolase [Deinococcus koreensis]